MDEGGDVGTARASQGSRTGSSLRGNRITLGDSETVCKVLLELDDHDWLENSSARLILIKNRIILSRSILYQSLLR